MSYAPDPKKLEQFVGELYQEFLNHQVESRKGDFCKTGLPQNNEEAGAQFLERWMGIPEERRKVLLSVFFSSTMLADAIILAGLSKEKKSEILEALKNSLKPSWNILLEEMDRQHKALEKGMEEWRKKHP